MGIYKFEAFIGKNGLDDFNFDLDDDKSEEMKKKLIIYVQDKPYGEDWDDLEGNILLTFVVKGEDRVMDDHISSVFPIFGYDEYDEPGEGFMTYYGRKSKVELIIYLRNQGFTVYDEPFDNMDLMG